ncbi:Indoleamine 2,3-dioxygenase [Xylariaceae sp. FL1272]|nr:Indoleamine 2,3-dioxygenase [Xylariaceae sp. FL1272]
MPSRIDISTLSELESSLYSKHSVTRNGFLPATQPIIKLPNSYYEPWEQIVELIPHLIKNNRIRSAVDVVPILSTSKLSSESEWRRAYVILSFLTHSYIWGGDRPSEILPPQITRPYLQVAAHLDLPPVATYAALNLWNFSSASEVEDFTEPDNLRALHTFTGTDDESWFYVLSVAVESRGAAIIPLMLGAIEAIKHQDYNTVTRALVKMAIYIRRLTQLLDRMIERCDPEVFYHHIRPFLAGTKNMESAGLPRGVFFDEGDGQGEWRQLRGGSNGQSSLIQFFDLVLGVDHTSSGSRLGPRAASNTVSGQPEISFHEEVRFYMPGPHRLFLEAVSKMDKIRDFAMSTSSCILSLEQDQVRQAYQEATKALGEFRQGHMQIVTRYIVVPSRRSAAVPSSALNLATASLQSSRSELAGTGGTALIPFLRTTRDVTYAAGMTGFGQELRTLLHTRPDAFDGTEGERGGRCKKAGPASSTQMIKVQATMEID